MDRRGRHSHAIFHQHGDRALHARHGRDGRHRLHPLVEPLVVVVHHLHRGGLVWPGWATGASTSLGFLFNWESGTINTVTVLGLVAIGIALTASPVVYQAVEKFQMVMVAV